MATQTLPPSQRRVLVVEDEYLLAMDLRDILQKGGFQVIGPAASVGQAIALLEQDPPDLCVLDVNLRGNHSAPVARALRNQGVPFVISSSYAQDTLSAYAEFDDITNIGKPVPPNELLSVLAALLKA